MEENAELLDGRTSSEALSNEEENNKGCNGASHGGSTVESDQEYVSAVTKTSVGEAIAADTEVHDEDEGAADTKSEDVADGKLLGKPSLVEGVAIDDASEAIHELTIPDSIPQTSEVAIEKLVYGMLSNVLPELQKAKDTLAEVTENQRILIETVVQENTKFQESKTLKDVTEVMQQAKQYHNKLVTVKRDMVMLHDKSAKLKKRALKLQQQKQKEALQREQERERELERERQLIAKTARTPLSS